jgi:hypothetical protein
MADTQRTLAALQVLLADNVVGDISPQDVRDFLVTSLGVSGGIAWVGNVTAQSFTLGVFTKVLNATDNMAASVGVTPTFGTSEIICPIAGRYKVWGNISASSATTNVITQTEIYVEGVAQEDLNIERKIATSGDVGAWSVSGIVSVGAGESIDLRINPDKTTSLTITYAQLWCELAG